MSPFEKRQRLAIALMHHAVSAWLCRPTDLQDPVVLIADSEDFIGAQYVGRAHGAIVKVVPAAELAGHLDTLDPGMAAHVRKADHSALYLACCAFNGCIAAYIVQTPDGLKSSPEPGPAPTYRDVDAVAVEN